MHTFKLLTLWLLYYASLKYININVFSKKKNRTFYYVHRRLHSKCPWHSEKLNVFIPVRGERKNMEFATTRKTTPLFPLALSSISIYSTCADPRDFLYRKHNPKQE